MSVKWKQVEPDQSPEQLRLRAGLGIDRILQERSCWRLNEELHVEIYLSSPESPNLIFLPGIGTYVELYAELLHAIREQGINVIAIDPPGHGYSAGLRGCYQVVPFCEQIAEVITELQDQYTGSWSIYGYSIGALVAVAAAERDSRIGKVFCGTLLLTENPPDLFHVMGWTWTAYSALFFPTLKVPLKSFIDFELLLGNHRAGKLINEDQRLVFDYPLATLSNLFTHRSGVTKKEYPFELSIIQGDRDEVLSLEYAKEVAQKLVQPTQLVILPNQGHMLPWDAPDKLAQVVTILIREDSEEHSLKTEQGYTVVH